MTESTTTAVGGDHEPSVAQKMFGEFAPALLTFHLALAKENGNTEAELIEAITHLAFYAGWPRAMPAMAVAKQVFTTD